MASLGMRFFGNLGDWLNLRRVFCCGILLAVEIGVFLFLVAGTHGLIVPLSQPTSTDFVSFYAAGRLADAGKPELAYDHAEHYAAEERATAVGVEYRFFYYPPVFLLLCAALAHLPYMVARFFLAAAAGSHGTYESGRVTFAGFVSPFGGMLLLGGTRAAAYTVQVGATLAAGLLVAAVWRRGLSLSIRAATLAAATHVAIPVVLVYDLMLAAIAAAWLIRDESGLPVWEKAVLAVLFVLPLNARGIAEAWHLPVAPLIALALLALAATHTFREVVAVTGSRLHPDSSVLS